MDIIKTLRDVKTTLIGKQMFEEAAMIQDVVKKLTNEDSYCKVSRAYVRPTADKDSGGYPSQADEIFDN